MKRNTILNVSVAVAVFFTAAIGAMSFKKTVKNADDITYYYNSNNMSEGSFHNVSNWTTASSGAEGCVSEGVRPCRVIVPEGSTLNAELGSKTNAQVLAIAIDRKAAP